MDAYYPSHSEEALAYARSLENISWDKTVTARFIGLAAAYGALARFIRGADLFIPPRNRSELLRVLQSYSADAVHSHSSQISQHPHPLENGGYTKALQVASKSLTAIVLAGNNTRHFLTMHKPPSINHAVAPTTSNDLEHLELNHSPGGVRTM